MGELDNLPLAAKLAFGGVLAVIFFVRYWGVTQGARADPAKNPAAASVAAVIVDASALNRHSDEVRGLSNAIENLRDELYIQREIRKK